MAVLVIVDDKLARKHLAKLLKELRGNSTQRQFAKQLGTSYTALQDWEKQICLPNDKNLKRIAQLKGWTQEELVLYISRPDAQLGSVGDDSLEKIAAHVQNLSLAQIRKLSDYLKAQLGELPDAQETSMERQLGNKQKHTLHLLLRASLKGQDPFEAMEQSGIEPGLFTDVFLRDNENRVVLFEDLEKFSRLCCRVIRWRAAQLPEIDRSQTYTGKTELLFNDLSGCDRRAMCDRRATGS